MLDAARTRRVGPSAVVIGGLAIVMLALALSRVVLMGDGLRHLAPILETGHAALGEPRWLFFPWALSAWLWPWIQLGWVGSVTSAATAFVLLDWVLGVCYLAGIDAGLRRTGVPPWRRAAVLLLAGGTAPLLRLSTDAAEPLLAATIVVWALVPLAGATADAQRRRLPVACLGVALATVIYQGTFLGVFLIPLVVRPEVWQPRRLLVSGAALALAPVIMTATLIGSGDRPVHAMRRTLTGEENRLYTANLKGSALPGWSFVAVGTLGPGSALVPIRGNRGLRGSAADLREPATRGRGAFNLFGVAVSLGLLGAGAWGAWRRRDWAIAVVFAGLLILPFLRSHQYSYVKFYVLFPALAALAAARARSTAAVAAAGIVVLSANVFAESSEIAADRARAAAIAPLYARAGADACWVASGWGPTLPGWSGQVASAMQILAGGRGESVEQISERNRAQLATTLVGCFCQHATVLTDDFTVEQRAAVQRVAQDFRVEALDLDALLWRDGWGSVALDRAAIRVFEFDATGREHACAAARHAEAALPATKSISH